MSGKVPSVIDVPYLGVGLGYRKELKKEIFASKDQIDFLEIITDSYHQPAERTELKALCEQFRVIPHGVDLSIGSMQAVDSEYLRTIKQISDMTKAPYYSEHLCVTAVPGIDIGHLSPLWFTEETLANTIKKVKYIQNYLEKPLILENVTYLFELPSTNMSQTEFFNRLVDATGCGVLLDLTNVFINSMNHHFDPLTFLQQMPLDHVVQVHLAGAYWTEDNRMLVDGHSEPVQEESWKLLQIVVSQCQVKGVIFEHDRNFPDWNILIQQMIRARQIMDKK